MTRHARKRSGTRCISIHTLVRALAHGDILEEYASDPRGPSALLLGHSDDGRPLHAVCAFDPSGILVIITVYEPQLPEWLDERTRSPKT